MKASELRIGNYVSVDNQDSWRNLEGVTLVVTGINNHIDTQDKEFFPDSDGKVNLKSEFETYGQFSQFIAPIPISEEWIIKFGFEKNRDYKHPFAPIYFIEIRNEWICFLHNCTHRRIKYVHQLQNLFHSITVGEELELK
ncbi:hypothetical protein [Chryseobacterium balustinum]|uniref:hypothetical protein n=1 Tax=Chryseobacterium balustinum TaxID=246 RepID=UPI003CEE6420